LAVWTARKTLGRPLSVAKTNVFRAFSHVPSFL
jgi:hypothetical protein